MKTISLDWMRSCCDQAVGLPERNKRFTGSPWAIEINGEPWSVATNGRALVAIAGDSPFEPMDKVPRESLLSVINMALAFGARRPTSVGAIADWCRNLDYCGDCILCDGTGKGVCERCGRDGADCEACGGDGLEYFDTVPGIIAGVMVNKRLLWNSINHIEDKAALIAADSELVAIQTVGALVLVMGLRRDPNECCKDVFTLA